MKTYCINLRLPVLIILSFLFLLAGCDEPNLQSKWRDRDIVVDGSDEEWSDCKLYTDKNTGTTIGVYNDNDFIYLCMTTFDAEIQQQFVRNGFILWFNETGGKSEQLGINYPTGLKQTPGRAKTGGSAPSPKQQRRAPTISYTEFEIMDKNKNRRLIEMNELINYGVGARFTLNNGKLVYELVAPLKESAETPYAALSKAGIIGMGFETRNFDTPRTTANKMRGISGMGGTTSGLSSGGGGGKAPGGGGGGGGREGGGDMSGSPGGGGRGGGQPPTFNIWTKITLATEPVAAE